MSEQTVTEIATHSPGPWTCTFRYLSNGVVAYIKANTDHDEVAVLYAWDGHHTANGHLIKAAPDLLAACRKALDELQFEMSPTADVVAAAIAKAEGRES